MKREVKERLKFQVYCPHLNRDVFLRSEIWHGKICQWHDEMKSKINLVKNIIENESVEVVKVRKISNHKEVSIFSKVPDFHPYGTQIRIGLKVIDDTKAEIWTAHQTSNDLPSGMETI